MEWNLFWEIYWMGAMMKFAEGLISQNIEKK